VSGKGRVGVGCVFRKGRVVVGLMVGDFWCWCSVKVGWALVRVVGWVLRRLGFGVGNCRGGDGCLLGVCRVGDLAM
jgi:hypothetical protein